jgi:hypothetical protein
MWELYQMAREMSQRPSELVGMSSNPWMAFDFDNAIFLFGRQVENEVAKAGEGKVDDKTKARRRKAQQKLKSILYPPTPQGRERAGAMAAQLEAYRRDRSGENGESTTE